MTAQNGDMPDSPLERAHALLVSAINDQAPGTEARYLARLALLLLHELRFTDRALGLIEAAREEGSDQAR